MITIIDYGVGNLFSLSSSLKALGLETIITRDADQLRAADRTSFYQASARMAMRLRNCADPEWQSRCWMKQKQANRSWESASECSFSLIKAMNTASIRVWD